MNVGAGGADQVHQVLLDPRPAAGTRILSPVLQVLELAIDAGAEQRLQESFPGCRAGAGHDSPTLDSSNYSVPIRRPARVAGAVPNAIISTARLSSRVIRGTAGEPRPGLGQRHRRAAVRLHGSFLESADHGVTPLATIGADQQLAALLEHGLALFDSAHQA